jgi:adenylate cyclase
MKYGVVGDDVNLAARAESFTVGGEVIVAESTYHAVGDQVEFRGPIEVKAKGKKEPMRLYAVVTVGGAYDLRVPSEHRVTEPLTPVSVPVDCFKLVEKAVVDTAIAGRIAELGADHAVLVLAAELKALDDVRLTARPAGQPPIDEIYAKVQEVEAAGGEWRCVVRFTSTPLADRSRFRALAGLA